MAGKNYKQKMPSRERISFVNIDNLFVKIVCSKFFTAAQGKEFILLLFIILPQVCLKHIR